MRSLYIEFLLGTAGSPNNRTASYSFSAQRLIHFKLSANSLFSLVTNYLLQLKLTHSSYLHSSTGQYLFSAGVNLLPLHLAGDSAPFFPGLSFYQQVPPNLYLSTGHLTLY